MLYGGKKIILSADGWDRDLEDEDMDEDDIDAIVVQFWVSPYSDDENAIEVETNGASQIPVDVAVKVAKSIAHLARWPNTKAGKKEIARLRAKHEEREEKRAGDTKGSAR